MPFLREHRWVPVPDLWFSPSHSREKMTVNDYEIKEMVCRQDGTIGEEILCCMKCGCIGVEVVDKKDMPKSMPL